MGSGGLLELLITATPVDPRAVCPTTVPSDLPFVDALTQALELPVEPPPVSLPGLELEPDSQDERPIVDVLTSDAEARVCDEQAGHPLPPALDGDGVVMPLPLDVTAAPEPMQVTNELESCARLLPPVSLQGAVKIAQTEVSSGAPSLPQTRWVPVPETPFANDVPEVHMPALPLPVVRHSPRDVVDSVVPDHPDLAAESAVPVVSGDAIGSVPGGASQRGAEGAPRAAEGLLAEQPRVQGLTAEAQPSAARGAQATATSPVRTDSFTLFSLGAAPPPVPLGAAPPPVSLGAAPPPVPLAWVAPPQDAQNGELVQRPASSPLSYEPTVSSDDQSTDPRLDARPAPAAATPRELREFGTAMTTPEMLRRHAQAMTHTLAERVMMLRAAGQSGATVSLEPESLGRVDVHVRMDADTTHVSFTTQHAAVRDVIEANLPRLRMMLEDAGLSLGNVNVGHSDGGAAKDRFAGADPRRPDDPARAPAGEIESGLTNPRERRLIDLRV